MVATPSKPVLLVTQRPSGTVCLYRLISHINKPYHLCISVVPNCTARMKSQLQQLVADETVSTVKGNGGAAGFLYQRKLF